MFHLILFLLTIQSCFGWNCPEYVRNYPENQYTISKEERESYTQKVCLAIAICHANPIIYSVRAYRNDITECYINRKFNFDQTLFDDNEELLESYVQAHVNKTEAEQVYDTLNMRAKDMVSNILDTVRLREAYLREYQYTQSRDFTGDILMLLRHDKNSFLANSQRQLAYIQTYIDTSAKQLETIQEIEIKIKDSYERVLQTMANLDKEEKLFDVFQQQIKENVIQSLLSI